MSATINRENSLLATFLYANDMGMNTNDAFTLNTEVFTSKFRTAVAKKINDETAQDRAYGFLSITLEDSIAGTSFEQEWANILSQTPLTFSIALRIHNNLEEEFKRDLAKRLR